jgi:NRAMP (natural resistance-associated macrophage protein)-like metal ion transporter
LYGRKEQVPMAPDPEFLDDPKIKGTRRWLRRWRVLGPGLITGAADDDPSGIGTYSQTGASLGFGLNWLMPFSFPLMCAVQIAAARLGRSTGRGIAANIAEHYPNWLLQVTVALLIVANTINIGADLGAMADALRMLIGGQLLVYVLAFGAVTIALEIFIPYDRYVVILKWLTLSLLAYVAELAFVRIDWQAAAAGFVPRLQWDQAYLATIVAVLGTTISPYLFFWQANEEVEDIHAFKQRHPLTERPEEGPAAIRRIRLDTLVGMGFSHLTATAIILATAATLNANGITDIETSAQAAEALRPIAGNQASILFAMGIIGTGLLAIPVLAGSTAYALGEARRWPIGLDRRPREAKAFYATIAVATAIGMGLNFTPINPVKALFWAAVINGVVAVPLMAIMMLMATRHDIMGKWTLGRGTLALGWFATIVMAAAVVAMAVTFI